MANASDKTPEGLNLDRSIGDFSFAEDYAYNAGVGLTSWCSIFAF